jgi:hypothetical protein
VYRIVITGGREVIDVPTRFLLYDGDLVEMDVGETYRQELLGFFSSFSALKYDYIVNSLPKQISVVCGSLWLVSNQGKYVIEILNFRKDKSGPVNNHAKIFKARIFVKLSRN